MAIAVDQKKVETATFREEGAVSTWLHAHAAENIYFHVNPTVRDLDKKAERTDVAALAWLHVDIDPRAGEDLTAEQERALRLLQEPPSGLPPPTVIIFSGGGYQGFWQLRDPVPINGNIEAAEDAKRYNLQLELLFGGDNTHNIDRVMRLPGTVNWPTAKKRKKGRVPALARLVEWHDDRVYEISQFLKAPLVQAPTGSTATRLRAPGNVRRLASVDELPVPDWCKVLIVQGQNPDDPTKYQSRSEVLFAVCCAMVRAGVEDDTIYATITDPDFRISESVLDKGSRAERYALKQIETAKEEAVAPELRELNERHAVIRNFGGKCRVIEEVTDLHTKRTTLTKQTFEDFANGYSNRRMECGTDPKGKPQTMPLGKWWLSNTLRRQYARLVFAPRQEVEDAYNLWQGFTCDARPGDCSLLLNHVRDNICGGKPDLFAYLLGWMARAVQQPDSPGYSAIVMRGRQGVGKSFLAKTFGSLWGRHFLHVSDSKHLVGSFNAHLRDCVFLFGDEAFYAGDRKHESVLKTLITEETLAIEAKGVDVEQSPNYVHLMMASNDAWVVPAGFDERRFLCLDVIDAHAQDTEYFGKIHAQMNAGGREALLHYLLTYDLTSFDVRTVPKTRALQEQKRLSFGPEEEWWMETKLQAGRLDASHDGWTGKVLSMDLQYDFAVHLKNYGSGRRSTPTRLGLFLSRAVPHGGPKSVRGREPVEVRMLDGNKCMVPCPRYYQFPDLDTCRAHWDANFGGPYTWPAVEEMPSGQEPF